MEAPQIGAIYTVSNLTSLLLQIPAGLLADKFGRKPIIVASGLVSLLSVFIFAFSEDAVSASVAYILFNSTFFMPAARAMLIESVPKEKRGTAVGAFFSIAPSLAVFGPIVGGALSERYGFKPLFWIGFCLHLATIITRVLLLRETKHSTSIQGHRKTSSFSSSVRLVIRNTNLFALILAYGVYSMAGGLTGFLVPLFSRDQLKLGSSEIGFMYSILSALLVTLSLPSGKLADKIGRRKCVIIAWIGENLSMLGFIFAPNAYIAILMFGFWIASGQMDIPAGTAWFSDLTDEEHRGAVMGFHMTVNSLFSLPSPSIGGILFSMSPRFPFFLDGLLSLTALIILLALTKE